MVDFGLLRTPDFAGSALAGYQAGQQIGRQRRFDAALKGVDWSQPQTLLPAVAVDPERGGALLSTSLKMAEADRQATTGRLFGDAVSAIYGQAPGALLTSGGTQSGYLAGDPAPPITIPDSAAYPSAPTAQPASAMPASENPMPSAHEQGDDDIVVTGHRPPAAAPVEASHPDPRQQAMIKLAYQDPDMFSHLQDVVGKMDDGQRKSLADSQDAMATASAILRKLPYEQRRSKLAEMAPWLAEHHVTPDKISGFDPTDGNIDTIHDQALGVKSLAEQADKDRKFALDQAQFNETVRSHHAGEATASGNLSVSQGNLALSRARFGHEVAKDAAKAGNAPSIGSVLPAPTNRAAYAALAAGTRYRAPDGSIRIK